MICIGFGEGKGGNRLCRQTISQFCFQSEKVSTESQASVHPLVFCFFETYTGIFLPTQNMSWCVNGDCRWLRRRFEKKCWCSVSSRKLERVLINNKGYKKPKQWKPPLSLLSKCWTQWWGQPAQLIGRDGGCRREAQPTWIQCQLQIVALFCNQEGIAEPRWGQLLLFWIIGISNLRASLQTVSLGRGEEARVFAFETSAFWASVSSSIEWGVGQVALKGQDFG